MLNAVLILIAGFTALTCGDPIIGSCPCIDLETRTSDLEYQLQQLIAERNGSDTGSCPCIDLEKRTSDLERQLQQLTALRYNGDTDVSTGSKACEALEAKRCEIVRLGSEYTTLHTMDVYPWLLDMCRLVFREDVHLDQYAYTVELYNQAGWQGPNSGFPGVIFNVIDTDNFDFVNFRPHLAGTDECVQHGYVASGKFFTTGDPTNCTASPVVGSTWFTVKVESSQGRATVYVNNVNLSEASTRYPSRSQTGVFSTNGFDHVMMFRNAAVSAL